MSTLEKYIYQQVSERRLQPTQAKSLLKELTELQRGATDVAIIGIACRFPGSPDAGQYWRTLVNGECKIGDFPEHRGQDVLHVWNNPAYMEFLAGTPYTGSPDARDRFERNGYLDEIDGFDPEYFGISPREATFMDPLQRKFLETVWSAVEDAGYGGENLVSSRTGVFAGRLTDLTLYRYMSVPDPLHLTGSWEGILASRISYLFNLRGPAMVVDTACSSGLVAVHLGCQALRNGECDVALAGGICLGFGSPKQERGPMDMKAVESGDGIVRAFDDAATGTVWGEGVGAVVLKPLRKAIADGDHVYAVIKGSGVNNDGASNGITAPNAAAQEELLLRVWQAAGVEPETISYVETHGTGTALGDPIEVRGLTGAFARHTNKRQFCGIGSVKTNLGHTVGASGMASLLKVVLALKHRTLPPTLNFERPNRHINFVESPVYVNDTLQPWNSPAGVPRRAGVSAFGFSGTNAHMLVEEYSPVASDAVVEVRGAPLLLPISAKNEVSLRELVTRYISVLEQDAELSLRDVAFTAAIGRGHFTHRVAVVGHSRAEWLAALNAYLRVGEQTSAAEQPTTLLSWGEHRIVSERRTERQAGELTRAEVERLSLAASTLIRELKVAGLPPPSGLAAPWLQLAKLYTSGASLDFAQLYEGSARRVSLPTYPYQRRRLWADRKQVQTNGVNAKSLPHPLLDRCLSESPQQQVFATLFSAERHWVLGQHRIAGQATLPGTAFLEIAWEVGRLHYGSSTLELHDALFMTPFDLEAEQEKELLTVATFGDAQLQLSFVSRVSDEEGLAGNGEKWVQHAQVVVTQAAPTHATTQGWSDVERARSGWPGLAAPHPVEGLLSLTGRWQHQRTVHTRNGQSVACLELGAEFARDVEEFGLHPALFDSAINALGAVPRQTSTPAAAYLPLAYRRIRVLGRIPSVLYSLATLRSAPGSETLTADVQFYDAQGQLLLDVEGYTLKRFDPALLRKHSSAYKLGWRPRADAGTERASTSKSAAVMLLTGEPRLSARVEAALSQLTTNVLCAQPLTESMPPVAPGAAQPIRLDYGSDAWGGVIERARQAGVTHFVFVAPTAGSDAEPAHFERHGEQGVAGLFRFVKALLESKLRAQVVVVGRNVAPVSKADDTADPIAAALFALARVASVEYPHLGFRVLDVDEDSDLSAALGSVWLADAAKVSAWRRGQSYLPELQSCRPRAMTAPTVLTRGVYLVTGGAGGIGLHVAQHLARKAPTCIALLGRSAPPPRAQWEALASAGNTQLATTIRKIREIESLGAKVLWLKADVCDPASLQPVIEGLRSEFGRINGVFHCAGVAGDGFIYSKEVGEFRRVISAKITGTVLLDHLTRQDRPELFVLFSSLFALVGAPGQSDYSAGNAFMDAYAWQRTKEWGRTLSLNWPVWSEVGMAAGRDFHEHGPFEALTNAQAMNKLDEMLASDTIQAIPAELNLSALVSSSLGSLGFALSSELQARVQRVSETTGSTASKPSQIVPVDVALLGKPQAAYDEYERTIGALWAGALGLTELDVFENYHSLGGDSLLAQRLVKALDERFPGALDITDIFSYPSVAQLAEQLRRRIDTQNGKPAATEPATDEQRIQRLLEEFDTGRSVDDVMGALY